MTTSNIDQVIFTIATAIIVLVATVILTKLPAKNPDWDKSDERV
ncbi:hypothetical protein [Methanobrevibacter sp.]